MADACEEVAFAEPESTYARFILSQYHDISAIARPASLTTQNLAQLSCSTGLCRPSAISCCSSTYLLSAVPSSLTPVSSCTTFSVTVSSLTVAVSCLGRPVTLSPSAAAVLRFSYPVSVRVCNHPATISCLIVVLCSGAMDPTSCNAILSVITRPTSPLLVLLHATLSRDKISYDRAHTEQPIFAYPRLARVPDTPFLFSSLINDVWMFGTHRIGWDGID